MSSAILSKLRTDRKLVILGDEARRHFKEIRYFMNKSGFPQDLVGPPGSGKTHIGTWAVIDYSIKRTLKNLYEAGQISTADRRQLTDADRKLWQHEIDIDGKYLSPAYFVGLDRESTKSGIILGYRLDNGTLKPTKSAAAEAMERGGAVALDEATHAQRGVLTMFNSLLDRDARASIGELLIEGDPRTRFIFMHNLVESAGNQPLPPSTASRFVVTRIGYPGQESETKIAKKIYMDELGVVPIKGQEVILPVPDSLIRYTVAFMREIREKHPSLPLSARNAAATYTLFDTLLEIADVDEAQAKQKGGYMQGPDIDSYFSKGNNAIRRRVASRIFWKPEDKVTNADMDSTESIEFMKIVTRVGVERSREAWMQNFMYHLDIDGVQYASKQAKEQIASTAI